MFDLLCLGFSTKKSLVHLRGDAAAAQYAAAGCKACEIDTMKSLRISLVDVDECGRNYMQKSMNINETNQLLTIFLNIIICRPCIST